MLRSVRTINISNIEMVLFLITILCLEALQLSIMPNIEILNNCPFMLRSVRPINIVLTSQPLTNDK